MSENPKKKLLIVESSDDESSIPTEQNSVEKPVIEQSNKPKKIISGLQ